MAKARVKGGILRDLPPATGHGGSLNKRLPENHKQIIRQAAEEFRERLANGTAPTLPCVHTTLASLGVRIGRPALSEILRGARTI